MTYLSQTVPARTGTVAAAVRRWAALARDRSEAGTARRFAAAAFAARVSNAGLGFATQILLARWMGDREYGIYAYVWVWLLVAGGIGSLGLPVAALKLIPDYAARADMAGLRGFLRALRGLALLPALLGAAFAAGVLLAVTTSDTRDYLPVALIALAILPVYVLTDLQTAIARAYDFVDLGLAADYLIRPVLLLALAAAIWIAGGSGTAVNLMAATLAATALTAVFQGVPLQARLRRRVAPATPRYDIRRWAQISWPLLTVTSFTLLLNSTDILVLKLFAAPEDIALYFAATKIVAIASFVSYGVANTSSHRFAERLALDDLRGVQELAADTVRWTFWPTLAIALVLTIGAGPLLSLFGAHYAAGWPVVAILALGLVAAATVGPADRALAMADHGRIAALIYGASFVANLGLALVLIPPLGLTGAALATALATALRAGLLFTSTRKRLGLSMFILPLSGTASVRADPSLDEVATEILTEAEAARHVTIWQDLAERALEPNVFYTPAMALAGMRHLGEGQGSRIVAAWRGAGDARRLVGILPVACPRGRHANPLPIRRAAEFYGTLSTPLLDPDRPTETFRGMLGALDRAGIAALALPFVRADGPVAAVLDELSTREGYRRIGLETHLRPMLAHGIAGADFARVTLDPKRRRKLERQRRRLMDEGDFAFHVATEEAEVVAALEGFFELETSGWKGRLGTSLRHAPGAADYMREAARDLARLGCFRIATLSLNGRAIASGLVALSGSRAFYVKIAYDEIHARLSPGILLTLDLSCHLLDDPDIAETDSLAVPDHPLYRGLWLATMPIACEVIATRPGDGLTFRAAVAFERLREHVRRQTRPRREQVVARLKRRPSESAAPEDHS